MMQDAYITWAPFTEENPAFFSNHGAAVLATNCTVPLILVAMLGLYWVAGSGKSDNQRIRSFCSRTACVGLLLWLPIYFLLPKMPVIIQRIPSARNENLHHLVSAMLESKLEEAGQTKSDLNPSIEWLTYQLAENSSIRKEWGPDFQTNLFTGQPWRVEDSPGNCTVRKNGDEFEYVWYDIDGGENVAPLSSEKRP